MQKKNSGRVVNGQFGPPQPMPQANPKVQAINAAQQMQAGFFSLRTQLFNTMLRNAGIGSLIEAPSADHYLNTVRLFNLAHRAATLDFNARFGDAGKLLESMGEKIDPAPLAALLDNPTTYT